MNKEYWLIEDNMKGKTIPKNTEEGLKLVDSFRCSSIKEAQKEFLRRNVLKKGFQYIITESKKWLN